jgi:hypothetical protein
MNPSRSAFAAARSIVIEESALSDVSVRVRRRQLDLLGCAALAASAMLCPHTGAATQLDIHGPAGSGVFGKSVDVLSNGNIVVADPEFDAPGPIVDVGAVYVYSPQGQLISTLTGSTAGDRVGTQVRRFPNHALVVSPDWDNGGIIDAGAVTQIGSAGLSGTVTAMNSIVGSTMNDRIGRVVYGSFEDGHYFVVGQSWDNGSSADVGAVRWSDGLTAPSGPLTAENSLIGSTAGDFDGCFPFPTTLSNGNIVFSCRSWDNQGVANAGAVIFFDRDNPPIGPISASNSLVGSSAGDQVGFVRALANGNYVVAVGTWDNGGIVDAGAVAWGDGVAGTVGTISPDNALVGSAMFDRVGAVTPLSNGNYVVGSPDWNNGAVVDAGAATWGSGTSGVAGPVSAANSLVGTHVQDHIGVNLFGLSNGNYVAASNNWNNVGAATWGSGLIGITGPVSAANSLVGSTTGDSFGNVTALSNGNYVVYGSLWGATNRGAIVWANGATGKSGVVSAANALIGGKDEDQIGNRVIALQNGNYVVSSPDWDNGAIADAGAVTLLNGNTDTTGVFDASGSLFGTQAEDQVGRCRHVSSVCVYPMLNGSYVVASDRWDNGGITDAGAVTWGNGISGVSGPVTTGNSLVGSSAGERLGSLYTFGLSNSRYIVRSHLFDDGAAVDTGAVTLGQADGSAAGPLSIGNALIGSSSNDHTGGSDNGLLGPTLEGIVTFSSNRYVINSIEWDNNGIVDAGAVTLTTSESVLSGPIDSSNSVLGTSAGGGARITFDFDELHDQLVVGRPDSNIVTLFNFMLFKDGFEQ